MKMANVGRGTNCELEATVVHCCLSLLCHLAGQKGLDVLAADSCVLACWNPPHCVDSFESLTADAALHPIFDIWTPGHWHLCYALNITFEWPFDFTQTDMPYIRECSLNLVHEP